jgi:drug/metabolite transporter (DMT)-like permease
MAVSQNLRGIGAMLVAAGAFVTNDTCMKLALADAPPFQVLIMRGFAACLWCLPVLFALGFGRDVLKAFHPWVVARSLCETMAILCFITGLAQMPIADLTAITQISPFVVLLATWLFFGERVGGARLALVGVGITGAMLVAQPGGVASSPFAIFGFLTAVGAAMRDVLSRKVPAGTPALVVTFSTLFIVMTAAIICSLLFETQVMPTLRHAGLMALAGFFLPFNYSFMLWAGLSGYFVFNAVPNSLAVIGMGLILAAGLAVIMLEGRTRQGEPAVSQG